MIPNPGLDPDLHDIVQTTMVHDPCDSFDKNSPCLVNGSCSKQYSRSQTVIKDTWTTNDRYPEYYRWSPAMVLLWSILMELVQTINGWFCTTLSLPTLSMPHQHRNMKLINMSIKYKCVNKSSNQAYGLKHICVTSLSKVTQLCSQRLHGNCLK